MHDDSRHDNPSITFTFASLPSSPVSLSDWDYDSSSSPYSTPSPPGEPFISRSPSPLTRKKQRKIADDHIPRPRNAFIIFRSDYINSHRLDPNQATVSKLAGAAWWKLSPEQKQPYIDMAEHEKAEHKRLHPDYHYKPHQKGPKAFKASKESKASKVSTKKAGVPSASMRATRRVAEELPASLSSPAFECVPYLGASAPELHFEQTIPSDPTLLYADFYQNGQLFPPLPTLEHESLLFDGLNTFLPEQFDSVPRFNSQATLTAALTPNSTDPLLCDPVASVSQYSFPGDNYPYLQQAVQMMMPVDYCYQPYVGDGQFEFDPSMLAVRG